MNDDLVITNDDSELTIGRHKYTGNIIISIYRLDGQTGSCCMINHKQAEKVIKQLRKLVEIKRQVKK